MRSLGQSIHKINRSSYKLDTSGVVALFGGDAAIDALTTIHLFPGRRWVGWYNYPGVQSVALKFGRMARNRLWETLFPGPNDSPTVAFALNAEAGPSYSGSFSGTKLPKTGYLGYLTASGCAGCPERELPLFTEDGKEGRKTGNMSTVTIVSLPPIQHDSISHTLTMASVSAAKQKHGYIRINPKPDILPFLAIVPSLISILACILSFFGGDPLCAALIVFGIVNGGISCLVLGTAVLSIRVPVPSESSPPGDGLMFPSDGSIIVLKGEEADVNIVTKGAFDLDYSSGILADKDRNMIGIVSAFLLGQSLLQLLLLTLVTFFGQIMFLASLVASGTYHMYVVSYKRERIHRELLFRQLSLKMEKWRPGTRTQMAVFVCLCVADGRKDPLQVDFEAIIGGIIPNDTRVWRYWRKKVLKEFENFWKPESLPYVPSIQAGPSDRADEDDDDEYWGFPEEDKSLLQDLIGDARCVFYRFRSWRDSESGLWKERGDSAEEKGVITQEGNPA